MSYSELEEPSRADHLWRYTSWKRIHPSGQFHEVPKAAKATLSLRSLEEGGKTDGVTLEVASEEDLERLAVSGSSDISTQFLRAIADGDAMVLRVQRKARLDSPVQLDIECEGDICALHLLVDVGDMAEMELITRISGNASWVGILRQGRFGDGCNFNDVVINQIGDGRILRTDGLYLGRDAQIRCGAIGSGSSRCKSDLRYTMDQSGSSLKVNGSILSAEGMHNDYHVEIFHLAPETYSRLNWHSACAGKSRTIGTGMLRIEEGAKGADAAQLFHNLLLSKDAEADSIPELEVSENDVVGCGHGTANGPVDDEQMFYLSTRGFNEPQARSVLIAAHLNSTLSEMGSPVVHEHLLHSLTTDLSAIM
ncbi:MAG: SufD family Fe-S cluster assembly protein [Candidatus Thermoplasmatota archaeon]|nr:SufD family Fe-S cluster assembly protein [Candidatus Thermoplasmatota archaeon]